VVGPLLGDLPGWVESPGSALAEHLGADGLDVRTTSRSPGRLRRSLDVASVAVRWRHQVDVVVVMVFSGAAFGLAEVGLRSVAASGAVPVAWLHGGGLPALGERRPQVVRRALDRAGAVVAPSPWLAEWAGRLDVAAEVIPNVVASPTPFRARTTLRPRLLWMRTYQELYDPELAVRTFALVHQARPEATLTMAGQDKGLRSTVQDLVHRLGLDGSVTVLGYLDGPAKADAFADHDLFLSTNRVDNAPVTLVEAGGAGVPVVAASVGGVPALLGHGAGGVLVGPRTPQAIADAVLALLADPERALGLAEAGRQMADRHRWDEVGPQWRALLERVARG
jgi:glycosyltransferase involved in cell wall biosynthesis